MLPLEELAGTLVGQVFIGGAACGRFEDLKIAADILKGKKINSDLRLIIQPASRAVYLEALKKGLIRLFVEAGADIFNPGCVQHGFFGPFRDSGETILSTQWCDTVSAAHNLYRVSPATAAISAVTGQITNPTSHIKT